MNTINQKIDIQTLKQLNACRKQCQNEFANLIKSNSTKQPTSPNFDIYSMLTLGSNLQSEVLTQLMSDSDPYIKCYATWLHAIKYPSTNKRYEFNQFNQASIDTNHHSQLLTSIFESNEMQTSINSMIRRMNHNTQCMVNRVCGFKARHSKLMIVRVDIGFSNPPPELVIGSKTGHLVFEDAIRGLATMLRTHYQFSYLHHEAKFEYAVDRGLHAHLLILLNGSEVREDETIGLMIAKYWRSLFPDGVAWAYNDNNPARKEQLRSFGLALGVFSENTPEFVHNVRNAVSYMAKPDYLIRIAFPGIHRTMRSAHIDQDQWTKKMRRPMVRARLRTMGLM